MTTGETNKTSKRSSNVGWSRPSNCALNEAGRRRRLPALSAVKESLSNFRLSAAVEETTTVEGAGQGFGDVAAGVDFDVLDGRR